MKNKNPLLNNIEQQTNLSLADIMKLANSLQKANLKDEKTLRKLIAHISRMTNIPVPKEREEYIVRAIMNDQIPKSLPELLHMFNQSNK